MTTAEQLPKLAGTGYRRSNDRNKPRIHIQAELVRLEGNLGQEALQLIPQRRQPYVPYIYNGLGPYIDMYTVKFLVDLPDAYIRGYHVRQLSTGLCDPWKDLSMDMEYLPKIETRALMQTAPSPGRTPESTSDRPSKEGSTMLPKFPVVTVPPEDLLKKTLFYSDVPALRKELKKLKKEEIRVKTRADYRRTVQDFYRMDLDRLDNQSRMKLIYHAYFHNSPGSMKAISDCMQKISPNSRARKGKSDVTKNASKAI